MEEKDIINRVAGSSLITLNLEELYPVVEIIEFDMKDLLFKGLMLRELELRDFVKKHDWQLYQGKHVCLFCSADAILPTWGYMLVSIGLQPFASRIFFGTKEAFITTLFHEALKKIKWDNYQDAKVVIKGCGDVHVPESVFVEAAARLRSVAASIMYGEPCSTVPLFKR